MARRDASTGSSAIPDPSSTTWTREAFAVVMALIGVGLAAAVLTRGDRWLGPVGHHVSTWLLAGFGVLAYPIVAGLLAVPLILLVQRLPAPGWSRLAGAFTAFMGAAILIELGARSGAEASGTAGELGVILVEGARPFVGPLGAALLGVGATLLGTLAAFRWSLADALRDGGAHARRGVAAGLAGLRSGAQGLRARAKARSEARSKTRAQTAERGKAEASAPAPKAKSSQKPNTKSTAKARALPPELLPEEPESPAEVSEPTAQSAPPSVQAETKRRAEAKKSAPIKPVILERKATAAPVEDDAAKERGPKAQFELPPLHLLDYEGAPPEPVDREELEARASRLEEKLETYGVEGRVTAIRPGPVVTTYEYEPAPGVKVSKIANLADDIAMSMQAVRVRIVAPIPGRGVVGIELPNSRRENVYLKELIGHDRFRKSKSLLTLAMGKDAEGDVQTGDLQQMPHLLVAGTTGSGKSVSINTMILSILYKATPEQVRFIMVDPKMLELSLYNDIPHLLLPVVTDARKASRALQWTVDEMERRYQMMSDMKVRDFEGFNRRLARLRDARAKGGELTDAKGKPVLDPWPNEELPEPLPYIVVLIDEFADLMCVAPRDVEASVQRLAQKARASGIHVLLATQRPSTDVITGVIKNNFPSRVSFKVASRHDSATVLNTPGAENLLGKGDSLFLSQKSPLPERIHGGFVSEEEVERVVEFWKAQAKPKYDPTILQKKDDDGDMEMPAEDADEHYDMAVRIVCETRRASISGLQRRLRVGYNRAARMIEMMEQEGIVGPAVGPKGEREVLVAPPPEQEA